MYTNVVYVREFTKLLQAIDAETLGINCSKNGRTNGKLKTVEILTYLFQIFLDNLLSRNKL